MPRCRPGTTAARCWGPSRRWRSGEAHRQVDPGLANQRGNPCGVGDPRVVVQVSSGQTTILAPRAAARRVMSLSSAIWAVRRCSHLGPVQIPGRDQRAGVALSSPRLHRGHPHLRAHPVRDGGEDQQAPGHPRHTHRGGHTERPGQHPSGNGDVGEVGPAPVQQGQHRQRDRGVDHTQQQVERRVLTTLTGCTSWGRPPMR